MNHLRLFGHGLIQGWRRRFRGGGPPIQRSYPVSEPLSPGAFPSAYGHGVALSSRCLSPAHPYSISQTSLVPSSSSIPASSPTPLSKQSSLLLLVSPRNFFIVYDPHLRVPSLPCSCFDMPAIANLQDPFIHDDEVGALSSFDVVRIAERPSDP